MGNGKEEKWDSSLNPVWHFVFLVFFGFYGRYRILVILRT
jgi:hypothetical protein